MRKLNVKNIRIRLSTLYSLLSTDNKGMTLLEIAISLAILTIALVALANLFPIGLKASRRAANLSEASMLAQRVIENIKRAAAVYDAGDNADFLGGDVSDEDGIGYFELADVPNTVPFNDFPDATLVAGMPIQCKYDYADTVYITVEDWDANGNGDVGRLAASPDWDDVLLSQKVHVAVYWIENDRPRADTFITYISNPFYEKYK